LGWNNGNVVVSDTIRLGDNPNRHTSAQLVSGKNPKAMLQARFVLTSVVLVEFAPITTVVQSQVRRGFFARFL
jgi:hypothetical protein